MKKFFITSGILFGFAAVASAQSQEAKPAEALMAKPETKQTTATTQSGAPVKAASPVTQTPAKETVKQKNTQTAEMPSKAETSYKVSVTEKAEVAEEVKEAPVKSTNAPVAVDNEPQFKEGKTKTKAKKKN